MIKHSPFKPDSSTTTEKVEEKKDNIVQNVRKDIISQINDIIRHPINIMIVDDIEFNIMGLRLLLKDI